MLYKVSDFYNMKINLNFLADVFLITLVACGGNRISENKKSEITTFEIQWQKTGKDAEKYYNGLRTGDSLCLIHLATAHNDSTLSEESKLFLKKNSDTYAELVTLYEGFKAGWDKDSKDWITFKNKALKGELDDEEVNDELEKFRKKESEAKTKLSEWQLKLDEMTIKEETPEKLPVDSTRNYKKCIAC